MATELNAADIQLARRAVEKLKEGKQLTQLEGRAHHKAQTYQDDLQRDKFYRDVPQWMFGEMCGGDGHVAKQTKQLQDMERLWGLPFARDRINLYEFFAKLWSFLIEHGPAFRLLMEGTEDGESSLGVVLVKAKIRKLEADADAAELRNAIKQGKLCDVESVHAVLELISSRVLRAADAAQKKWGMDGFEFIKDVSQGLEDDIQGAIDANEAATDNVDSADVDSRNTDEQAAVVQE